MTWKHALFIGGSLVLLAACDQATAPQPQLKQSSQRASVANKNNGNNNNQQSTPQAEALECRSGYTVQVGKTDCQQ